MPGKRRLAHERFRTPGRRKSMTGNLQVCHKNDSILRWARRLPLGLLFCIAVGGSGAMTLGVNFAKAAPPQTQRDAATSLTVAPAQKNASPAAQTQRPFDPTLAARVDAKRLERAIHAAAGYLIRSCDAKGQFVYQVNLDPKVKIEPSYNMIRHAGAIYALDKYNRLFPSEPARQAIRRAADFLDRHGLAPVSDPTAGDMLAVWCLRESAGGKKPTPVVELGSAGLGVVAFAGLRRIAPDAISQNDLRRLGQCLIYMQKDDGDFFAAFDPEKKGLCDHADRAVCLYYPGEATLGLLMVNELDPDPVWRHAAAKAITYLSWVRRREAKPPVDHWALIATAKLFAATEADSMQFPRELWRRHAASICRRILADRNAHDPSAPRGDLAGGGYICGTACRLEGLLAARTFLQDDNLNREISMDAADGINFLLDSQIHGGPCDGAFTQVAPRSAGGPASNDPQATEVRVDYVQHALDAMVECAELIAPRPKKPAGPSLRVKQ